MSTSEGVQYDFASHCLHYFSGQCALRMHVCTYIHGKYSYVDVMCVCVRVGTHVCVCMWVRMCVCACGYARVCVRVGTHVCVCTCGFAHVCVCKHKCVCVSVC